MNRSLAFWQGLALVLLGLLIGVTLGRFGPRPGRPAFGPEWGPPRRPPLMAVIARELDLTPSQRDSLAVILERHRRVLESQRRAIEERMGPERDSLRDEVRAILTPEQQGRFDRIVRGWERRRHGRGGRE